MTQSDDSLWAEVAREVDDESRRNAGLWARCFSTSDGDTAKAKARYMNARMQQMGRAPTAAAAPASAPAPNAKSNPVLRWVLGIISIVGAGFVALVVMGTMIPDDESSVDRAAIDMCWSEHKNSELDSGTRRFVADTCNMMEREYKQKYGRAR